MKPAAPSSDRSEVRANLPTSAPGGNVGHVVAGHAHHAHPEDSFLDRNKKCVHGGGGTSLNGTSSGSKTRRFEQPKLTA